MSIWTYIKGTTSILVSPYKAKLSNDGSPLIINSGEFEGYEDKTVPHKKEQISIDVSGNEFRVKINSFPIAKEIIKNHIQKIPSGEHSCVLYFVNSYDSPSISISNFSCEEEKNFSYELLKNTENYNKEQKYELEGVDLNTDSILTIHSPIRWHDSTSVYNKFIKFLEEIVSDGVYIDKGIFTIEDGITNYLITIGHNKVEVKQNETNNIYTINLEKSEEVY